MVKMGYWGSLFNEIVFLLVLVGLGFKGFCVVISGNIIVCCW